MKTNSSNEGRRSTMRRAGWAGAVLAAGLLVLSAGCSSDDGAEGGTGSDGTGSGSAAQSAPATDLLVRVADRLGDVGLVADDGSLICDGDLDPSVGATTACEFTVEAQPVGLTVSVTEIVGDDYTFSLQTEARPVSQGRLEELVKRTVEAQMDGPLTSIVCESGLGVEVGGVATCTLTDGDITRDVQAAVSSVDGGLISISMGDAPV